MFLPTLFALSMQSDAAGCCGGMERFASDPAFVAAHLNPLPIAFTPAAGKMVTFPDSNGKPTTAFWVPAKAGVKSAVVMVHEFWGLNAHIKATAERLNRETGYGVLAVDLYDGKVSDKREEAAKLMQSMDQARARAVVKGAVRALKDGAVFRAAKIGTIGYCLGGGWSHIAALEGGKDVNACVIYYGMPDMAEASLARLRAPVLMVFGSRDRWINQDVVDRFSAAMKKAGKSLQVLKYDADHAFANPSNPAYDAKNAEDAWRKTLAFYAKHL